MELPSQRPCLLWTRFRGRLSETRPAALLSRADPRAPHSAARTRGAPRRGPMSERRPEGPQSTALATRQLLPCPGLALLVSVDLKLARKLLGRVRETRLPGPTVPSLWFRPRAECCRLPSLGRPAVREVTATREGVVLTAPRNVQHPHRASGRRRHREEAGSRGRDRARRRELANQVWP